jgi:hypothetical protein
MERSCAADCTSDRGSCKKNNGTAAHALGAAFASSKSYRGYGRSNNDEGFCATSGRGRGYRGTAHKSWSRAAEKSYFSTPRAAAASRSATASAGCACSSLTSLAADAEQSAASGAAASRSSVRGSYRRANHAVCTTKARRAQRSRINEIIS